MIRSQNSLVSATPICSLEEILKCVICYDKCVEARMCPHCSKLCCKLCFRKWLTENRSQCPHCRASLRFEQLVSCRFLSDISQAIETLSVPRSDLIEKCAQHECPLNYYCTTCIKEICSDCAMFSPEHKGHEFQHLSSVYNKHLAEINTESKVLSERIRVLESMLAGLETTVEKLKCFKAEKGRELSACFDQMIQRLDDQLNSKTFELNQKRDLVSEEIRKLKYTQNDIDRELSQVSKNKLILKSPDLLRRLKDLQMADAGQFNIEDTDVEFSSEVVPRYESGLFELRDFTSAQPGPEVVYSDVVEYNGLMWRLKVYPNGNGVAKGNYLSVFLELLKGYGESAKYDYRVEMINYLDPSQMVIREFASDFETGECWGYNRFFKISLLKEQGYLSESDALTMKFYVRAPTYYQLYKDQKYFIRSLQEKENSYKVKLSEFMEKIEDFDGSGISESFHEDLKVDEVSKENTPNPPNELSTVMQKYLMSPDEESSDELTPVHIDWTQIPDLPDFQREGLDLGDELDWEL